MNNSDADVNQTMPFDHRQTESAGLLLINLGTPSAPTARAVRRYFAEFLVDPRVVEAPRWLWRLVLHLGILRLRPRPVARKYASVWSQNGSPLLAHSQALAHAASAALATAVPGPLHVDLAMTYGQPDLTAALARLHRAGVRRLLVLPLYPQYSATTTAAAFDALARVLKGQRWLPEIRWINAYHDFPGYIDALAQTVRAHWQEHGRSTKLLMSFHGIPQGYYDAGDPYPCHCRKTARLLAERLTLGVDDWALTFQSRFGRAPWVKPYTDQTLIRWANEGVRSVQVICPGFSADCLETLEEIDMENRNLFLAHGGESFQYIAALNDSPEHVDMVVALTRQHGAGWPELEHDDQPRLAEAKAHKAARLSGQ